MLRCIDLKWTFILVMIQSASSFLSRVEMTKITVTRVKSCKKAIAHVKRYHWYLNVNITNFVWLGQPHSLLIDRLLPYLSSMLDQILNNALKSLSVTQLLIGPLGPVIQCFLSKSLHSL